MSPTGDYGRYPVAEQDREEPRSLSDMVIRAGAVAAALASIAGLVALLWPDDPVRIAGKFDSVDVRHDVSLAEFSGRQQRAGLPSAVEAAHHPQRASARVLLVSHSARLHTVQNTEPAPDPQPGPSPQPEPEPPPGPEPEPPPGPEPEPQPGPEPEPKPGPERPLDSMSKAETRNELIQKLPSENLPSGCGYDPDGMLQCAKTEALSFVAPSDVDDSRDAGEAVVSAKNLLKVLRQTRARPVSGGRTEPVGVTVNFQLTLDGLEGKKAEVRWSLYDAGDGHRVPRDWLVNRTAVVAESEAASDRGGGEFWVPLPKQRGPFFIRLIVSDDEGGQLDRADSKPFR